jgi:drug/metabolite transporter (DMT)-like permease
MPPPLDSIPKQASIVLAFASVYFFWGSTYTAIRIGATEMPALLLAGTRFLLAGSILLAWCAWRGLRIVWPRREMLVLSIVALLLLGGGNVGLVYAEKTVPSGFASLALAVMPLYVALIEYLLPGGETLPWRGWLGILLGILGLSALLWPSIRQGIHGNPALLLALGALLGGNLSWAIGSIYSRRQKLAVNSFVAAAWQMLIAGGICVLIGSALGQWTDFHLTARSVGSLAYLITGGSLLGYSGFVYLIEHVPVAKVSSYSYVNPMVAVLLGVVLLHERFEHSEFLGMALIVLAVFLLTTARVNRKTQSLEEAKQL